MILQLKQAIEDQTNATTVTPHKDQHDDIQERIRVAYVPVVERFPHVVDLTVTEEVCST